MRLRQSSAGVPAGLSRSRSRAPDHYVEQGAAEALGLLPMLGQERCDYLVRLVDQLSPIV
jgi:hypothetical protein